MYEKCSVQCASYKKSTILFSSNIEEVERSRLAALMGMRVSQNTDEYLSLPNIVGRRKEYFQSISEKMFKELVVGAQEFCRKGKEIFIKSVLQAIPSYAMPCFLLPRTFCDDLERLFGIYWWGKGQGKKGFIGVSGNICAR